MHSSMKRFNRLLNVNVNARQDQLQQDHEFTAEEQKHVIRSSLFNQHLHGNNLELDYSSTNQDLQTLLRNVEYAKLILNNGAKSPKNELLDPSSADDMLWFGGEAQEHLLANALGVTQVIIRVTEGSWNHLIHNAFKYRRIHLQDYRNFRQCRSRYHEWIMVVNEWISDEFNERQVRFDYVIHHGQGNKEVIFSRYFTSLENLNELYGFNAYLDAVKQQTTILSLDGVLEEVQDEKH